MQVRAVVVVGIVTLLYGAAEARPKSQKRHGTFAAYIDDSAPDDPPRPHRPQDDADSVADLAVAFVIERSTDHLDAAKQLVRGAVAQLAPNDYTAVIAFDSEALVFVRPTRAVNQVRIDKDLSRLQRGNGTNLFTGLKEAFELLQGLYVKTKLIVLITDGDGPEDGVIDLVSDLQGSRIRLITIGTKRDNLGQLTRIADNAESPVYFLDDPPKFKALFDARRGTPSVPEPSWLSITLMIDRAAATAGTNLDAVKRLIAAIDATIWGDDLIAVLAFHDSVDYVLEPTWAGDPRIRKVRKKLKPAAGPADLAAALTETCRFMTKAPGRKIVVLVTDGAKTGTGFDEATRAVRTSNIELIVVGTPGADELAVRQLAREMGARDGFQLHPSGRDTLRLGPGPTIGLTQLIHDAHYNPPAKRANARWTTGSARSASPPPP
jgi:Mg-chelatase subunit ChlD